MEIETLRLFLEVATHGNFAETARRRDIDPSAVSRAIAGLEDALGFRLFQRTTRRVKLTEPGALYLAKVGAIVAELDQARDEALAVTSAVGGRIRLTASLAFGQAMLMPLLTAFRAAFPQLRIDLLLTDSNLDLVGENIDLAVRLGAKPGDGLISARLFQNRHRVCASPAYLARHEKIRMFSDLQQHECLRFDLPDYRSRWRFRENGVTEEVDVDGPILISSALALHQAALEGLGPALLPNWLIDTDFRAGRLIDIFPKADVSASSFDGAVWICYPSRSFLPRKTRVVIDFLVAMLRPLP